LVTKKKKKQLQQPHPQTKKQKTTLQQQQCKSTTTGAPRTTSTKQVQVAAQQQKYVDQLESARFRWINEQLYNRSGNEAQQLFAKDPQLFHVYHRGYQQQMQKWPDNPVDIFIKQLSTEKRKLVVADFGCGEAKLAKTVRKHQVHSFDLVALNELVTACDISSVPLESDSIDVGIFCLSLMGKDFISFLLEAHRVLKTRGELKIAEVKSRFNGRVREFVTVLHCLGFDLKDKDESNKMFVLFYLKKSHRTPSKEIEFILKPCRYKKR